MKKYEINTLLKLKKECPEIYEEYSKDSSVSSSISIEVE